MDGAKKAEQSCKENPDLSNNDTMAMKDMEMGMEKHKEDVEDIDEDDDDDDDDDDEEEEEDEETEESEDDEDGEQDNKLQPGSVGMSNDGRKELHVEVSLEKNSDSNMDSPIDAVNSKTVHTGNVVACVDDGDCPISEVSSKRNMGTNQKPPINGEKGSTRPDTEEGNDVKPDAYDSLKHRSLDDETISRKQSSPLKVEHMKEELKNEEKTKEEAMDVESRDPSNSCIFDADTSGGGESGTEDEQGAFMLELEKFHKERNLDFKPPKFYGEPLNLLKLWRAVMRLGGYDKVTACKFWRQVGESFKPPKTCTTVSWTFRIFYEKALLDYERHRTIADGSTVSASLPVPVGAENQAAGSGRARRDAAARAMKGWHSQRILDNGEVSDPIIKDKNSISLSKKEKQLKNLGVLKRKKPSSTDAAAKAACTKMPKSQSETTVIDIGSPADWVKINVRVTKDCYEVYALVPGLLREEVRVQSDPAGRLVISGEPENPDNPWGVTPFKKVVSLPSRIDPHQTSAVVTLHGQLFVRVPFEQYG